MTHTPKPTEWDQYWALADARRPARPARAPRTRWARIFRAVTGMNL